MRLLYCNIGFFCNGLGSNLKYVRGFPGSLAGKESACNAGDPDSIPGLGRSIGEGIGYPLQYSGAFPCGSASKESTCNAEDLDSIPGLGRCPGEGKGYPFQYSGLQKSMDCMVHEVTMRWTQLSNFHLPARSDILKIVFGAQ